MLKQLLSSTKKLWKTEGQENIITPLNQKANFILKYKDLPIGTLKLVDGVWSFEYSLVFKNQELIKPLPDFPTVEKTYKSKTLYPFFLQRIPSIKQPSVQKIIKNNEIDETSEVDMLKFFGLRTITNPFLLQYC